MCENDKKESHRKEMAFPTLPYRSEYWALTKQQTDIVELKNSGIYTQWSKNKRGVLKELKM